MCLSVNKAIENCCDSIHEFLGARLNERATAAEVAMKENTENNKCDVREANEQIFISDKLALTTQYTRNFFKFCTKKGEKMQSSTLFK